MSISEFCNRNVIGVAGDTPVIEAAALMRQHHVGDVIVVEEVHGQRKPVGIVTDRDLVVEVMASGLDPRQLKVSDLVSGPVVTIDEGASYAQTVRLMSVKGRRRMPVVGPAGESIGMTPSTICSGNSRARWLHWRVSRSAVGAFEAGGGWVFVSGWAKPRTRLARYSVSDIPASTRFRTRAFPTTQSVVRMRPAIEAAFCNPSRVTFVGSMIPIATTSPNSSGCRVVAEAACAVNDSLEPQSTVSRRHR